MIIFFVAFFLLLLFGMPMAFALAIPAALFIFIQSPRPLEVVPQEMYTATNSFPLMAILLFLLAGELMNRAGITQQLVEFSRAIVGWIRGGLAQVTVVSSMLFAGISGSGVADAAAVGSVMVPSMTKEGFSKDFSAALTSAASVMGPIIPPSIVMVVYGATLNVPIGHLFAAGILPGILVGLGLMVATYILSRHQGERYPFSFKALYVSGFKASLALAMPLIIVGGILGGIFTATEAGAVAVFYAFFVGTVIYRTLSLRGILEALTRAGIGSATIMLLVAASRPFGYVLTVEQIPAKVADLFVSFTANPLVFLLLVNLILLVMGMFMETTAIVLIVGPILAPVALQMGIDPIHFALIMIINLLIGLATPPLGLSLFVMARIGNTQVEKISRQIVPFFIVEILVLLLVTYIPQITLIVPELLGYVD